MKWNWNQIKKNEDRSKWNDNSYLYSYLYTLIYYTICEFEIYSLIRMQNFICTLMNWYMCILLFYIVFILTGTGVQYTQHTFDEIYLKKKWKLHEYPLTCVVWYRICIDGIVVVSFKCIDLEPMLLVSSSAKSACLYRVIWKNNNKRIRIKIDQASLIHLNEWTAYNRCVFNTHFHRHASTRRAIS